MKRLTSKVTYFHKRLFPILWFGILGFMVISILVNASDKGGQALMALIAPILMAAAGYFMMKKTLFDLIDEVYDEGSTLLFRNGSTEVRVDFRDIKNISYSRFSSPARITVSLRNESALGTDLSFSPPGVFHLFKKSAEVEDLIDRIDAARR